MEDFPFLLSEEWWFCTYGLARNALCHRSCLSELDRFCGSVAQHRVLAQEAWVRYHGRTTIRGFKSNWEVSSAVVTTRANG